MSRRRGPSARRRPVAPGRTVPHGRFSPLDVEGLRQWLDAELIPGLSNGDPGPATWVDQSGNGNHAAKTGTVVYDDPVTAAEGPALRVNAGGEYNASAVFTGATAAEVFVLLRAIGDPNDNPGMWILGGSDRTYYPFSDGKIYDGAFTGTRYSFDPAPNLSSAFRVYNVACGGGTWTARLDGNVLHTASVAYVPRSAMNLGGQGVANFHWEGWYAKFLAYDRVLDAAERADVTGWMLEAA